MNAVNKKARYFAGLERFAFLGFGVYGSGGLDSIARSKASDRRRASVFGSKSSLAISAARSAGVCVRFRTAIRPILALPHRSFRRLLKRIWCHPASEPL